MSRWVAGLAVALAVSSCHRHAKPEPSTPPASTEAAPPPSSDPSPERAASPQAGVARPATAEERAAIDELVRAADAPRPHVTLDLSGVDSLHPAAVAAIVAGAWSLRRTMGSFRIVEPDGYAARRALSRVSVSTLIL
jgi:hypothetical protein